MNRFAESQYEILRSRCDQSDRAKKAERSEWVDVVNVDGTVIDAEKDAKNSPILPRDEEKSRALGVNANGQPEGRRRTTRPRGPRAAAKMRRLTVASVEIT